MARKSMTSRGGRKNTAGVESLHQKLLDLCSKPGISDAHYRACVEVMAAHGFDNEEADFVMQVLDPSAVIAHHRRRLVSGPSEATERTVIHNIPVVHSISLPTDFTTATTFDFHIAIRPDILNTVGTFPYGVADANYPGSGATGGSLSEPTDVGSVNSQFIVQALSTAAAFGEFPGLITIGYNDSTALPAFAYSNEPSTAQFWETALTTPEFDFSTYLKPGSKYRCVGMEVKVVQDGQILNQGGTVQVYRWSPDRARVYAECYASGGGHAQTFPGTLVQSPPATQAQAAIVFGAEAWSSIEGALLTVKLDDLDFHAADWDPIVFRGQYPEDTAGVGYWISYAMPSIYLNSPVADPGPAGFEHVALNVQPCGLIFINNAREATFTMYANVFLEEMVPPLSVLATLAQQGRPMDDKVFELISYVQANTSSAWHADDNDIGSFFKSIASGISEALHYVAPVLDAASVVVPELAPLAAGASAMSAASKKAGPKKGSGNAAVKAMLANQALGKVMAKR